MDHPRCFRCHKTPEEIAEYVEMANEEDPPSHPDDEARGDGTYNPETNTFACTDCYIAIGMPATPWGWKAPAIR